MLCSVFIEVYCRGWLSFSDARVDGSCICILRYIMSYKEVNKVVNGIKELLLPQIGMLFPQIVISSAAHEIGRVLASRFVPAFAGEIDN